MIANKYDLSILLSLCGQSFYESYLSLSFMFKGCHLYGLTSSFLFSLYSQMIANIPRKADHACLTE